MKSHDVGVVISVDNRARTVVAIPRRTAECILTQNWYRAGRELMRYGQTAEAGECYRRSLHWNAWNVKT